MVHEIVGIHFNRVDLHKVRRCCRAAPGLKPELCQAVLATEAACRSCTKEYTWLQTGIPWQLTAGH